MLRSPDGRLVILDFGLMTRITDDQKYGMVEAIAHLIHRDYDQIGQDFVNLDFIPKNVDTKPIIPALTKVFDAALAGGGAKSINFQELAADLADITFKFPFRIPPYFALIIRAISVLEGIALVGNPEFAIVDEAYPFIAKMIMTDRSPRLRAAFRYMVYGKTQVFDVDRVIDMLQALEKFVAIKDSGDGSAFKVDGMRGGVFVGRAGDSVGTKALESSSSSSAIITAVSSPMSASAAPATDSARAALKFFFSDDGDLFRELILDEISGGIDALSRDVINELLFRVVGGSRAGLPSIVRAFIPPLSPNEQQSVEAMAKLLKFLMNDVAGSGGSSNNVQELIAMSQRQITRENFRRWLPVFREFAPNIRQFALVVVNKLVEKGTSRVLRASSDAIFGPVATPILASTVASK